MAYQTINPATGEVVKTFPAATDADVDGALTNAQAAFHRWRLVSIAERKACISRAAGLMRTNIDRLAGLVTLEMGKLLLQAKGEVSLSADILDYYAARADSFLAPQELQEAKGASVIHQPLGILMAVEPWNFPYYQLARVAGPQLMVGNVVICKHASSTPQCAAAFEAILLEAGVPAGVYTNLYASFDQVSRIIDDERVKGVMLTGSERAGMAVAERAARNLKKSVLELGGSDPLIILPDAPFEPTVENVIWGRMNNTGQSCVASKRVIVVGKSRGKQFLDAVTHKMSALKCGDPTDPETTLGPVSSEAAVEHLVQQIETARSFGASVVLGGKRIERPGFYLEPTILTNIDKSNPIYQEELFGPVISFYVVETEDEAIALANATPFGLGSSIFTSNIDHGRKLAERIDSGMVFVNHPTWTSPELPFGGVKRSGYGRELSVLGFGEFVNKKLVSVSPAGSPPPSASQAG